MSPSAEESKPQAQSFAHSLPEDFRRLLEDTGELTTMQMGDVVFTSGDPGDSMYLVVSGEVALLFDDGKAVKRLGPGEVFGELAFVIGDHTRTATAVSTEEGQMRVYGQEAFERLYEQEPRLPVDLLRYTCGYLLQSEQSLIGDLIKRNRELESALDFLKRTLQDLDGKEVEALTDDITGLYNRRCLDQQLQKHLDRVEVTQGTLALVMLELDGLEGVTKLLGPAYGNLVLRQVAGALKTATRNSELPCYLGGEIFGAIIPFSTDAEALARAEEIHQQISKTSVRLPQKQIDIAASAGGTMYRYGESIKDFFGRSLKALSAAKDKGASQLEWISGSPP